MKLLKIFFITFLLLQLNIQQALACACGCGVFNVGTSSLIPNSSGGMAFLQYDYINQNHNQHNDDKAPLDNSDHKKVQTQVVTAGMQYMFNRKWGLAVRVPYVERKTIAIMDEDVISNSRQRSLGDVRINAIYSGFFDDMSTGITFGLKLPTGNYKHGASLDRDVRIGTGSTDSILGAYHMGKLDKKGKVNYFMQGSWQHALNSRGNYRIGDEFAAATGIYYNAGSFGTIKKAAPILQITGSKRLHDSGFNATQYDSGYTQIFFAPGLEMNFGSFKAYADMEFPLYQNVNGNQLVANRIYKIILGYNF